jgi:hypothetical protein
LGTAIETNTKKVIVLSEPDGMVSVDITHARTIVRTSLKSGRGKKNEMEGESYKKALNAELVNRFAV